jgi:peptide/nickel transport system ATP-binding protein
VRNLVQALRAEAPDLAARLATRIGAQPAASDHVHAVDDVRFAVGEGEVVGLVGEIGCGKSTLGRMIAGILPPSAGTSSSAAATSPPVSRDARARPSSSIQMIFQDPMSSLNPRMRVRDIVGEAPLVHGLIRRSEARRLCRRDAAPRRARSRHRKRATRTSSPAASASASASPARSPSRRTSWSATRAVAALDVSIQAQVLNLFMDLRRELGLTYLFISHDLGVVEHISDRVVIMYLGRVVETAPTEALFAGPAHPYTQALLDEVPRIDREAPLHRSRARSRPPRAAARLPFPHPLPACRPPLASC